MANNNINDLMKFDTTNPANWGMYKFDKIQNVHDKEPLSGIEVIKNIVISILSLAIYFGLCFGI